MQSTSASRKESKEHNVKVGESRHFDFLVLGGGLAGASLALRLSKRGSVALVTKSSLLESNTRYAQGGIASVLLSSDSFESHIRDTLVAGAGLCHEEIVEKVIMQGPDAIKDLINWGVDFTRKQKRQESDFHLNQEGGHSSRRIYHVDDLTGQALQAALAENIRSNEKICLFENFVCIDLMVTDKLSPDFSRNRCFGAYILETKQDSKVHQFFARGTFVATGGHGKLYKYTSNPDIATGDGIAIARRAGARVANLEFMQFHPTCLFSPKIRGFLISEAVRGEGGRLLNVRGDRFMEGLDSRLELAPRDVVARAIDGQLKKYGDPFVLLDISHKPSHLIERHFPNILRTCLEAGIDMRNDPIPVVPAAHYSCGGIVTDGRGRTGIKCLWALGEVACTGLHGANRLASNSLLEGLAFAQFASQDVDEVWNHMKDLQFPQLPKWEFGQSFETDELGVVGHLWSEIRNTMWNYVGIVRTMKRLRRAEARLTQLVKEIEEYYWNFLPHQDILEVRNLASVALMTVQCALSRKESRGTHFSLDHSASRSDQPAKDTVLV